MLKNMTAKQFVIAFTAVILAMLIVVVALIAAVAIAPDQNSADNIITITASKTDSIRELIRAKSVVINTSKTKIYKLKKQSTDEETKVQHPDYSIDSVRVYIRARIQTYRASHLLQR